MTIGLLLAAACLSIALYLGGIASTLRLGDSANKGFLLIPDLPTPLYIVMALVVLISVSITLLHTFLRRREPPELKAQRRSEPVRPRWHALVALLLMTLAVVYFLRWGGPWQDWLQRWRSELSALQAAWTSNTQELFQQVNSPVAGYALFGIVVVIYGGIALLGLWALLDTETSPRGPDETATQPSRQVQRAVAAGLRALQQHDDPREAIIACYARLEHLLEDHGVAADQTLTPQEYMGAALRGIDLPLDAFARLVELFELARYSLHPLDETAKQRAMAHLQTIQSHLAWEAALATRS
jgi:hypothetical protein